MRSNIPVLLPLFLSLIFFSLSSFSQSLLDTTMAKAMDKDGYKDTKIPFRNFFHSSTEGKFYTNDSLKNKVTFISFWFEACAPCVAEFSALNSVYKKFGSHRDFQFLSFTFETTANAVRVAEKYNLKYPVLCIEQKDIHHLIFQLGFPTTIITDKSGVISFIKCGGPTEEEKARDIVDSIYVKEIERLLLVE